MTPINTTLTEQLAELTNRLFWLSESDFPFQIIAWDTDRVSVEQLLRLTYHPPDRPVERTTLEEFFAPALQERDGYEMLDAVTLRRYRQLYTFLRYHLSDIRVYRVGTNPIYVYIMGITRDDNLAGIATQVVETIPKSARI